MRVWAPFVSNITLGNATQNTFTLADAASFGTTSGNTKHIGTLVRVKMTISVVTPDPGGTYNYGIFIQDVGETVQNPSSVNFGQDEDLLAWDIFNVGQSAPDAATGIDVIHLDLKSKRRFNVESELAMTHIFGGQTGNSFVIVSGRALFLVP